MTKILVIAFPDFQNLFVEVVRRSMTLEAMMFMGLFPVFELMISAAVERGEALAAFKESLFSAYFA